MKQLLNRLFVTGLLVFTQAWADTPNYDTNSGIVSFPRVSVNDKDKYINANLLLNPNGSWRILDYKPEPLLNLTGEWKGTLYNMYSPDWSPTIPCGSIYTTISLTQNGNELTGKVKTYRYNNCDFPAGLLTGRVAGNEVAFTVVPSDFSGSNTNFSGHISDDKRFLVGTGSYETTASEGNWVLIFDK